MKTVLIALFEGIEAKNLLRTDVIRGIVADEDVRAVLLLKSKERVEYYKKEFSHPRLVFIEAPYPFPGTQLDRFFGWTKFLLLNTETTRLRRWIAFKDRRYPLKYLEYPLGLFFSWLFARGPFRSFLRFLDFSLVRTDHFKHILDTYQPDLVLLANLFDEPETALVREAKQRGIRTIGLVNSWDKVTARMMIRILPDSFVVFNHSVEEELRRYDGVSKNRIFIGGMPHFDAYKKPATVSRGEFLKLKGIPSENKLVVFAPFGRAFNDTMWETIDLMHEMNSRGEFGNAVSILVRFQPNDFLE
ncbi:MAG: hypothetical protein Q7R74_00370 [bacterium]|nr:hypothetical protein [bacterium]